MQLVETIEKALYKLSLIVDALSWQHSIIFSYYKIFGFSPATILFLVGEISLRLRKVSRWRLRVCSEREFQFFALVVGLFYLQHCVRQNPKWHFYSSASQNAFSFVKTVESDVRMTLTSLRPWMLTAEDIKAVETWEQ